MKWYDTVLFKTISVLVPYLLTVSHPSKFLYELVKINVELLNIQTTETRDQKIEV